MDNDQELATSVTPADGRSVHAGRRVPRLVAEKVQSELSVESRTALEAVRGLVGALHSDLRGSGVLHPKWDDQFYQMERLVNGVLNGG